MSIIAMVNDVKVSRRERYAAQTCEAVLGSAKTLFVSKGFDATSVDEIADLAQASKGAVYHHFRDKQAIFTELFRTSQEAVITKVIEAMPTGTEEPWAKVQTAIRLFLHGYVADDDARALLRQVVSVLGWERVRALNEQQTLPFLRATLESFVANGHARPVPIEATVELFFSMFYNAVLFITDAKDPDTASTEVETVIMCALEGLKPPRG
ncbi:TetR/AcrR family transcriptional regulator [Mycolicibacterium sp. P9-22]|uniref:TetR/AcrR family transcriptional regulator n=1 Tax=Mycolicibacterium sp. P9-22 TaxID=2024613 RepID=UPI0011EC7CC8|nr:TetR/AcrR family transcriptional regulator [Mycolicibacterium sp. P9-22]KAA0114400.1 TetR/AcrR family transcriptional regulator [Mycolicibacterium sp. P9-22]